MPIKNSYKLLISIIFLFVIITLFVSANVRFISRDAYHFTDWHMVRALIYYDRIFVDNNINLSEIPFPPLVYFVTSVFFKFGGISQQVARISITFFAIVFLLAMFGIGYELGGYYSAVAVTSLAAASPHILNVSRLYFLEFPQTALTALAFYLLLKTDSFKNRKYSILFGVVLAISFLAKWSTAFFMIAPILWFLIPILIKKGYNIKIWLAFIIPAIITLIGVIWYFKQIPLSFSRHTALSPRWILYFLLIVVVPGMISIVSLLLIEKKINKDDSYTSSGTYAFANFAIFSITFAIVTIPWFFYCARQIKQKSVADLGFNANFLISLNYIGRFLMSVFNFYPVFLMLPIIGLVFMLVRDRDKLFRRLVIPVNIIFTTVLMFWILSRVSSPQLRYLLSLIIFLSALGGYWVTYLGRAKAAATVVIFGVSLLSILYGVIPAKNIFFPIQEYGWRGTIPPLKIICAAPVDNIHFKLDKLIEVLSGGDRKLPSRFLMIEYNEKNGFKTPYLQSVHMRKVIDEGMFGPKHQISKFRRQYQKNENKSDLSPEPRPHPELGRNNENEKIQSPSLKFRAGQRFCHPETAELVWLELFKRRKYIKSFNHMEGIDDLVVFFKLETGKAIVKDEIPFQFPKDPREMEIVDIGEDFRAIITKRMHEEVRGRFAPPRSPGVFWKLKKKWL
ncbi:MAG: glycosyltransferase family 39 protein [Candidatus Eremiobacteraeota bacterium]|nr:glycosyltransferase family 39 protein [Candidatus Eremiobacteraeota bacterium]